MYLDHPAALLNQLSNFRPLNQGWGREEGGGDIDRDLKILYQNLSLVNHSLDLIYT